MAAFDVATGNLLPWNPDPGSRVNTISVSGGHVYVLTEAGYGKCIDSSSGTFTQWQPQVNFGQVHAIHAEGNTIYLGGNFSQLGGVTRNRLAAVDTVTGALLPWNPNVSGYGVYKISMAGNEIFVAGSFSSVGGQIRSNLAAVNKITGALLPFNAGPINGAITSLQVSGNKVYVGGNFTGINNISRRVAAAIDVTSGTLLPWNAKINQINYNSAPRTLSVSGSSVFLSGISSLGETEQSGIAAINTITGQLVDWNSGATYNSVVRTMLLSGDTLFLGGYFASFGAHTRKAMAAIKLSTRQ
ncbi:MAG: hypothetical protein EOP49_50305, partial [Sphingobacteriales bacterium]